MKKKLAGIAACLILFTACGGTDVTFNTQTVDTSPVETSVSYITDTAEEWLNAHTTAPVETEPEVTETEPKISEDELVLEAVKNGLTALGKKDRNVLYNAVDMDILYFSEYGDIANAVTDDIVSSLALDTSDSYEITDIAPVESEQYADMMKLVQDTFSKETPAEETTVSSEEDTAEAEETADTSEAEAETETEEETKETSVENGTPDDENSSDTDTDETTEEMSETTVSEQEEPELALPDFEALKEQFGITDVYCVTVTATVKKPVVTEPAVEETEAEAEDTDAENSDAGEEETSEETTVSEETTTEETVEETEALSKENGEETSDETAETAETEVSETEQKYEEITVSRKFYVFKINDSWKLDVLYSYAYNNSVQTDMPVTEETAQTEEVPDAEEGESTEETSVSEEDTQDAETTSE